MTRKLFVLFLAALLVGLGAVFFGTREKSLQASADDIPVAAGFGHSQQVIIQGYNGSAEEPFLTPDGQYLIFDSRTDFVTDSNIYYAKKIDDATFRFLGEIRGVNTPSFEGVVSIDDASNFYFMSLRNYDRDFTTVYSGVLRDGAITNVMPISGISVGRPRVFDLNPDISPDGAVLRFFECDFNKGGPLKFCVPKLAVKNPNGQFTKLTDADPRMIEFKAEFKNIYGMYDNGPIGHRFSGAVSLSRNGLEAFFEQINQDTKSNRIYTATRGSVAEPFGMPQLVGGQIDGFNEGAFLSRDGNHLYYHHAREGTAQGISSFGIYMLTRLPR